MIMMHDTEVELETARGLGLGSSVLGAMRGGVGLQSQGLGDTRSNCWCGRWGKPSEAMMVGGKM